MTDMVERNAALIEALEKVRDLTWPRQDTDDIYMTAKAALANHGERGQKIMEIVEAARPVIRAMDDDSTPLRLLETLQGLAAALRELDA